MEIGDGFLIFLPQDDIGPQSMAQHQNNCDNPGYPVDIKRHPSDHCEHHSGAPGMTDEAEHKENQMPGFQAT